MHLSSAQRSPIELVTVGDFDPQADGSIEYDFIGRVIARRYTIHAHIGGGGMADVYQATDEQLGIEVAIKLLKPRMASDELRARMVQEAQAAAQFRHANIVRVFGTGPLDTTAFIAMELLDGPNLEQYLRDRPRGRLPCHEALELLLPAMEALHEVHERGYIHRDIKAGNILVARAPGRPPSAVVIDLGLVKPDRALRNAASPPTTEVGRMLCTPGYTSPEQAAGRAIDRRSDIYSMAVTLYRALAGRLPFHDVRGQPLALLAKHIYNEPTMLAEAAQTADIPVAVAAVVEGALSKDPAKRPQTMQAFAEALRAAAKPAGAARRPHFRRARELLLAIGAGATAALLVTPTPICAPAAAGPIVQSLPTPLTSSSESTLAPPGPAPDIEPSPPVTVVDPAPASPTGQRASTPVAPVAGAPARPITDKRSIAATRRALDARTPGIQACADRGAGGLDALTVGIDIGVSGKISTRIVGAPETPLSRCIDAVLRPLALAGTRGPVSFTHTFTLRPTPHRP